MTRDLKRFSEATRQIRDGNPYTAFAIDQQDEIGQLACSVEKMHVALQIDELTGLYHRETFSKIRKEKIFDNAMKATPDKFAVLFVDLDHFKATNSAHGDPMGSNVIEAVGEMGDTFRSLQFFCVTSLAKSSFALRLPYFPATRCDWCAPKFAWMLS